jgi:hypothetical protein
MRSSSHVLISYQLWLAAFEDRIPDWEMYAYWSLKDVPTPRLDAALAKAAYLYVGAWREEHESMEAQAGLCPARRVFDWLFLRGTETQFRAPVLSEHLTADLLHCFAVRPDDLPAPAADPSELSNFLATHLGFSVLPEESAPAA